MPNKDYIARRPTKKKKNNPYKQKAVEQTNNTKTILMIITIILLVAGAAYSLWFLKTSPTTKTPNHSSEIKILDKKAATLPKPPKVKWQYVDDLKHKEVEVGEYEVKQNGPYKMQCGSFKTSAQAEALKAKMAFAGIESQIQTAQGKSSIWYKVVLGPYSRKRAAEQEKHKLRNNNINGCQIWLWK